MTATITYRRAGGALPPLFSIAVAAFQVAEFQALNTSGGTCRQPPGRLSAGGPPHRWTAGGTPTRCPPSRSRPVRTAPLGSRWSYGIHLHPGWADIGPLAVSPWLPGASARPAQRGQHRQRRCRRPCSLQGVLSVRPGPSAMTPRWDRQKLRDLPGVTACPGPGAGCQPCVPGWSRAVAGVLPAGPSTSIHAHCKTVVARNIQTGSVDDSVQCRLTVCNAGYLRYRHGHGML